MKAVRNPDGTSRIPAHHWSWRKAAWPLFASRLAHSDAPILVGPWRGEIGFEALYWIPFIEQFIHDYKIDRSRVIPISRGGAAQWYGVPQGFEIYGARTPQQVRVQNRVDVSRTGVMKQIRWTDFDRALLCDVADSLKATRYHVLHPAWMYHTLAEFYTGARGLDWVVQRLRFKPIDAMELPGAQLPETFVAVRFYSRATFAASHKQVMQFVAATIDQLTSQFDVVVLDHPFYIDDHAGLTKVFKGPRIYHLHDLMDVTPENNLLIQSAALKRAAGFVGTYGGFAQLALRMGKPSVSFYVDWGNQTAITHRNLADLIALRTGVPAVVVGLSEVPMLGSVLPIMEVKPAQRSPIAIPHQPDQLSLAKVSISA